MGKERNKIYLTVILAALCFVFFYISFAFATYELNPGKWDSAERFLMVYCASVFSGLITFKRHS